MTRSVRYQPILHTLYYTLHTEHAYCLSYRFLNNVVITTVIEMVETVEILDGRLGKLSVERVRYVINNLLHLVIVKYGDISLVLCISTRLRLVTILSQLVKYLVILHADPCNKSYIYCICHRKKIVIERTRDIIYLKFVATDFSPKISSPNTGENCWRLILQSSLLQRFTAESSRELSALRKLNNKQRQVSMFLLKFLIHFPFVSFLCLFSLYLYPLSTPFLNPLSSPSPQSLLSLLINSLSITFCFTNGTSLFSLS